MRKCVGIAVAVGTLAFSFGAGYFAATAKWAPRVGEAVKQQDEIRTIVQFSRSSERSPATDRLLADFVLDMEAKRSGLPR
jgi:hypothetical protein